MAAGMLAVGVAGEAAFSAAVARVTGFAPVRPPFLSARLVEDGPGLDYLRAHCAGGGASFALCRYRDRLPLASDIFLWSGAPGPGVALPASKTLAAKPVHFLRSPARTHRPC